MKKYKELNNGKLGLVIMVVYKLQDKTWRGFCAPYDVACNAENVNDAKKRLEELVCLYESGLKKYNYPSHLVSKPLSDKEDKIVFNKIWPKISEDIKTDIRDASNKSKKISMDNISAFIGRPIVSATC